MKSANRVFKNTMFLYVKMFITVFSSLYTTRLILNALGASDFGIFSLVGGLISMLIFLNAAMTVSSQRFMSYAKGKGDLEGEKSVFNISLVLHFGVAFVLIFVFEVFGSYLFDGILKIDLNRIDAAKAVYQFMILSTFFTVLSVPYDAIINANENMLFIAVLGIIESFIKLGIALYLTKYFGDKLILYGMLIASLSAILMFIKCIYSHKKYIEAKIDIRKYFNKVLFKKMSGFAGYTFLGISTQMITSYGQGFILNIFFGTIVNAAQGIVNQVSGQLGAFANTMMRALNPLITKSEGAGNRDMMLEASFVGSKISFFLLIFFYVPILFEMPIIFKYWLVNIPEYTILFCMLLLFRNLIEQLYLTLATAIISVGKIKRFQIYNSILNLLPLPAAYILFKLSYPPYAIYIVFIVYSLLQGSTYIYFAKKECGMSVRSYFNKVVAKAILSFLLILIIVSIPHILMEESLYRLLSVIVINIFAFLAIIWLVGLTELEKKFVKQIVSKVKAKVRHE